MDGAPKPRSRTSEMSDDEVFNDSLVCAEEEFNAHEIAVQESLETVPRVEKRGRIPSDEKDVAENDDNEGFTVVNRPIKMRRIINRRKQTQNNIRREMDTSAIEVCVSSIQVMPKQIGLAKLLKTENIPNVSEIKYKSPYKVFMKFASRADAVLLVNNVKFMELGYRCRFTNEVSLSYGVVKYIEMEMNEEDLIKGFSSEVEIAAIKRLKRLNDSGSWSESETVRFSFKSATLPQYVYGFDCRFKVEPYTFPVTQCSVCWKFGHVARMCPSKRTRCPKCSGDHANCEITEYRCINCKGHHMAFYKKCPVFLKEKKIRQIMCNANCTYKMALSKFLEENKTNRTNPNLSDGNESDESFIPPRRWENTEMRNNQESEPIRIVTTAEIHQNNQDNKFESERQVHSDSSSSEEESKKTGTLASENKNKKKSKTQQKGLFTAQSSEKKKENHQKKEARKPMEKEQKTKEREGREEQRDGKDKFKYILSRLQGIIFTNSCFEEKLKLVLKFILEEVMEFVVRAVSNGDIIRKLMNLFYDG